MKKQLNISINTIYGSRTFSFGPFLKYTLISIPLLVMVAFTVMVFQLWKYESTVHVLNVQHKEKAIQLNAMYEDEMQQLEMELEQQQLSLNAQFDSERKSLQKRIALLESSVNTFVKRSEFNQKDIDELKSINFNLVNVQHNKLQHLENVVGRLEEITGLSPVTEQAISERIDQVSATILSRRVLLDTVPNGLPVGQNKGISSAYGNRIHPIRKRKSFHHGIDYRGEYGDPVIATADGIVSFAKYQDRRGLGKLIVIEHDLGFKTRYGHLKKVLVKEGQWVTKGDLIGHIGSTGLSSGPHLHYEVLYADKSLNPYYFAKWGLGNFNEIFTKVRDIPWDSFKVASKRQVQKIHQQLLLRDVAYSEK